MTEADIYDKSCGVKVVVYSLEERYPYVAKKLVNAVSLF